MANFNKPTFTTSTTDITPPLVITNLPAIFSGKGLLGQSEKSIRGKFDNYGFVDATFESMMRSVGWQGGQAWCAYYMKVVLMQLYSFDRDWIAKKLSGSAYGNLTAVEGYNKQGDKRYLGVRSGSPEVADVVSMLNASGEGGHTFMVTELLGGNENDGWKVRCVEGNTNNGGSREGDKVLERTRTIKVGARSGGQIVKGYIRRNFTESELALLKYDDAKQTFVFANQVNPSSYNVPLNTRNQPASTYVKKPIFRN